MVQAQFDRTRSSENHIYHSDNLPVLERLPTASVDLCYLDPPYCSDRDYQDPTSGAEFQDTWTLDAAKEETLSDLAVVFPAVRAACERGRDTSDAMVAYLAWMAERLIEVRRVLEPSGAMYLQCDTTAEDYLSVLCRAIWRKPPAAKITWRRTSAHDSSGYGRVCDRIIYYGPGLNSRAKVPLGTCYTSAAYKHEDEHGRYRHDQLFGGGDGGGVSAQPWRGVYPPAGRHWSVPRRRGTESDESIQRRLPVLWLLLPRHYWDEPDQHARLEMLDAAGLLYWGGSRPQLIRHLTDAGRAPVDLWDDIPPVTSRSRESVGVPTQKPLALLKRIIDWSTEPGDLIVEGFAGAATACVAAENAGRRYIGIDLSFKTVGILTGRLAELGLREPTAVPLPGGSPVEDWRASPRSEMFPAPGSHPTLRFVGLDDFVRLEKSHPGVAALRQCHLGRWADNPPNRDHAPMPGHEAIYMAWGDTGLKIGRADNPSERLGGYRSAAGRGGHDDVASARQLVRLEIIGWVPAGYSAGASEHLVIESASEHPLTRDHLLNSPRHS